MRTRKPCAADRKASRAPSIRRSTSGHTTTPTSGDPSLATQFRDALHQHALAVHYQPIVAADATVLGAEALVRWPHPTRGTLGPNTILPLAEHTGLLIELDQWVLRTALREATHWPHPPHQPLPVTVNLSALTPGHPELIPTVNTALAEFGLDGTHLILEIVETALPTPLPQARHDMHHLAHYDIRCALDDFGAGYSTLTRLKNLPFSLIKLDRSLTTDLPHPNDTALIQATTTMASALDCTVIAEGIETQAQLDCLHPLGIPAYQGWLFAPALPTHKLHQLLAP